MRRSGDRQINHLAAVVTTDPSVIRVVREHPDWREVIDRPVALLAEPTPGPDGVIAATAVLTGLAGAAFRRAERRRPGDAASTASRHRPPNTRPE
ncbi:hypothetical protein ACIHDR_04590 [Nocardia sp. NPDC052278]|uniref:hypothetical protein n=1 Tax=unclassified Nocardia TaxID=2637762 RepID=UPI003687DD76